MKHFIKILLLLTVAVAISGCGSGLITDDGISRTELMFLHNEQRQIANLPQFEASPELQAKAQKWAEWMARNNSMTHSTLSHSGSSFGWMGENIAMGYPGVDEVTKGWMDSAGHRHNILNEHFTHAGFGYARMRNGTPYWCAEFGGH